MLTVERADLVTQVHAVLRMNIIQGKLKPGERLNIDRLARELDVSPTPIKNAVGRLDAEGLVEYGSRGGAYVAQFTRRDIDELFEIRTMIEQHAAKLALQNATESDCDQLEKITESLRTRIHSDGSADFDGFAHDDMAFHAEILRLAGNQRLAKIYESLHSYTIVVRAHAILGDALEDDALVSGYKSVYRQHGEIVRALRERDHDALREAIDVHLHQVHMFAVRALDRYPERSRASS